MTRTREIILGLNAWHGDAAACLLVDGRLVAAVEEERFRRVKHWAGFPSEAVRWCLADAGVEPEELSWIAVNRDPRANLVRKVAFALRHRPSLQLVRDRSRNAARFGTVEGEVAAALRVPEASLRAQVARVEHHRAHLASSYLASPFNRAALISVDGFGDFSSSAWGVGTGREIEIRGRTFFPHSLGLFYQALTQWLGFPKYGDEYKVMGLAAHGAPRYVDRLRPLAWLDNRGDLRLALECFQHHTAAVTSAWNGCEPTQGSVFSAGLERLLGPARRPEDELDEFHADMAASVQRYYEELLFRMLRRLSEQTGQSDLCLSGGCAMNSLANGRILEETPFERLFVPPAPGDAGGAVGAALSVWCERLGRQRVFEMDSALLGPSFGDEEIAALILRRRDELDAADCVVERIEDEGELCDRTAARLAAGDVVGWFQGRMEWGPRALGNRSILADPRRDDMRDVLNTKIKLRETFRPFAPAVLREEVGSWFDREGDVPFMLQVWPVRADRHDEVPAVTHADGSGRLQTVEAATNPRFHRLLGAFRRETGVPILVNTSFNENEPVVCTPEQALNCFLRTRMDCLIVGSWLVRRRPSVAEAA
ncbi:MAG: carbamoyltransferase C-terminal domain-containing protein [Planctomycetota bacterium]